MTFIVRTSDNAPIWNGPTNIMEQMRNWVAKKFGIEYTLFTLIGGQFKTEVLQRIKNGSMHIGAKWFYFPSFLNDRLSKKHVKEVIAFLKPLLAKNSYVKSHHKLYNEFRKYVFIDIDAMPEKTQNWARTLTAEIYIEIQLQCLYDNLNDAVQQNSGVHYDNDNANNM